MIPVTVHRHTSGDPDAIRFVEDGFRWSVFLIPPAGLFARRLWTAGVVWIAIVAAVAGLSAAGLVTTAAAAASLLVVNLMFALDAPEMERRRLVKGGWPMVATLDPRATAAFSPVETRAHTVPAPVAPGGSDVIGLFPDGRGR